MLENACPLHCHVSTGVDHLIAQLTDEVRIAFSGFLITYLYLDLPTAKLAVIEGDFTVFNLVQSVDISLLKEDRTIVIFIGLKSEILLVISGLKAILVSGVSTEIGFARM